MNLEHHYALQVEWTGNRGSGTSDYKSYGRDHLVRANGNPTIVGTSDRAFRGDPERWNPEQLLLAALSQCHMLSYLHEAAVNGVNSARHATTKREHDWVICESLSRVDRKVHFDGDSVNAACKKSKPNLLDIEFDNLMGMIKAPGD